MSSSVSSFSSSFESLLRRGDSENEAVQSALSALRSVSAEECEKMFVRWLSEHHHEMVDLFPDHGSAAASDGFFKGTAPACVCNNALKGPCLFLVPECPHAQVQKSESGSAPLVSQIPALPIGEIYRNAIRVLKSQPPEAGKAPLPYLVLLDFYSSCLSVATPTSSFGPMVRRNHDELKSVLADLTGEMTEMSALPPPPIANEIGSFLSRLATSLFPTIKQEDVNSTVKLVSSNFSDIVNKVSSSSSASSSSTAPDPNAIMSSICGLLQDKETQEKFTDTAKAVTSLLGPVLFQGQAETAAKGQPGSSKMAV